MWQNNVWRAITCFVVVALVWNDEANARQTQPVDRCGTMQLVESAYKKDPTLRARLQLREQQLQQNILFFQKHPQFREETVTIYVPVVFHVVLTNPNVVTDAQIQAQLDTLNHDFAGMNGDSGKIPAAFKPLFGHSTIQFVMAQRTPNDDPSNGIERISTSHASFSVNDTSVKYTAKGGADAWDPNRFFNVWLANLSGGILGYGTIPGTSTFLQEGVVILYSSLPGGTTVPYDKGRTLTHETGHFFDLYHIWGDDGGACTGSDSVADTPNQGNFTSGCPNGAVVTDPCTPTAPGILYQDYMDYTDDACMLMFTNGQVARMLAGINLYRPTLLTSNGGTPVALKNLDASITSINGLRTRICNTSVPLSVTLRNRGIATLTSADIFASVDGGAAVVTHWTGSLVSLASAAVNINTINVTQGTHNLQVYVTNPNSGADQYNVNDTLNFSFAYNPPVSPPLTEGFEGSVFPPAGWDIVNPDNAFTWEKATGIAHTGNASVVMKNFDYQSNGPKDYLRLPLVNISSADSAFMTFEVAAAVQTDVNTTNNVWDTLEVLASTDCGVTYTSLYKHWGRNLVTHQGTVAGEYIPTSDEWRKDSVNLTPYINAGPVMLAFLNTTEFENNIYLDDINVYSMNINPILKEKGFLVTPNPTTGMISVQFYPDPVGLRGIAIYNMLGQKVAEQLFDGTRSRSTYNFDLAGYASGVYIVQVVTDGKKYVKKIIKK